MSNAAVFWLICNILSIIVLAFYSMLEMACVSFNKVRLQYYVSKGVKQAIWLNYLLQNPSHLFGTTLIGVNFALVIGSECSREFYAAIGLSPDLAPITQVFLVVIFGELAPMFAARHHAEHVAMLGVPLVYLSAKLMTPLLWGVSLISKLCNLIVGGRESENDIYLTQEELQKILEERSEEHAAEGDSEEFSEIAANIFSLRNTYVGQIMDPLNAQTALPANMTIGQLESSLKKMHTDYIPIYHRNISNIVGIIHPRDLLRAQDNRRIRDYARSPWFVMETTNIMQILKQFRTNNESLAVIVDMHGKAIGTVNLDDVLEEIFGKILYSENSKMSPKQSKLMLIEKTFPGNMSIGEFANLYGIMLDPDPSLTLADLIASHLEHRPEKGDAVYIAPFELTVKEVSVLDIKSISISSTL
jgi:CBS domain containing-hemolysin-like protein